MTKIEWTWIPGYRGRTWNPIRAINKATGGAGHFCVHVNEACRNCYAERWQPRLSNPVRYAAQEQARVNLFLDDGSLRQPGQWKAPSGIFVCSMTDLFGEWVKEDWLDLIFGQMAICPHHIFIILTKRPERARDYLRQARPHPLANVWVGVSVHDQPSADLFVPVLLDCPAAKLLISYEPALGPVDFSRWLLPAPIAAMMAPMTPETIAAIVETFKRPVEIKTMRFLDWIIAGGESGPKARPANPQWFRDVRDQCAYADVPFFYKQTGEWASVSEVEGQGAHFRFPDGRTVRRVGKALAGRLLDGREHNGFPRP